LATAKRGKGVAHIFIFDRRKSRELADSPVGEKRFVLLVEEAENEDLCWK
jgi:hypothetical protein